MTAPSSTSSSVEVAVDRETAFTVFTEEVGCRWRQGPINFFDSTRAYGVAIEPGVGGRLMEVYDPGTGEGLELGVISVWEPGARLAWRSSLDDVETQVRFEATSVGTLVGWKRRFRSVPEAGEAADWIELRSHALDVRGRCRGAS